MIKVSVIIPVYNCEDTITNALDSVLSQTLDSMEIICIDDGSTDKSFMLLQEYAEKNKNIIVRKQENLGAGPARNLGLKISSGEFIAFLDADDWYPRVDTLETLYNKAKENNVLICGGSLEVYRDGKLVTNNKDSEFLYFKSEGILSYSQYQFDYYYQRFIYNRNMLIDNKIQFPNYRRFQDPPFFVSAMIAANTFYVISQSTYCYKETVKVPKWDLVKMKDFLRGLKDLLTISMNNHLENLHKLTLFRIENSLMYRLEGNFGLVDDEFVYMVQELNHLVNRALLKLPNEYTIRPYRILQNARKFQQRVYTMNNTCECVFRQELNYIPKVSVVVPVYNVEQYLSECLDSLINQSLREIEIICINDGSNDSSLEILKRYANLDNRIRIYTQKNAGLSVSRNVGMAVAIGQYIDCIDSDDYLDLNALEILYNRAVEDDLDMVLYNAKPFGDGTCDEAVGKYENYYKRTKTLEGVYSGVGLMSQMVENHEYLTSGCFYTFKRSLQKNTNICYIPGILHEDNAFTFEILISAGRVGYLANEFYLRRVHGNSIMTSKKKFDHAYGYFKCYREMEKCIDKIRGHMTDITLESNIYKVVYGCLSNARNTFSILDENEQENINVLNTFERILFEEYIINCIKLKKDVVKLKKDIVELKKDVVQSKNDKKMLERKLKDIESGCSFRIGRLITYIPRKICGRN